MDDPESLVNMIKMFIEKSLESLKESGQSDSQKLQLLVKVS